MEKQRAVQLAKLLQSCIEKKSHLQGKLLHGHITKLNIFNDTFLFNRLIDFYSKCNNTTYAQHVFDQMPLKDIYSWNSILTAHTKTPNLDHVRYLFDKMPQRNQVSWNNMISVFVKMGFEEKAFNFYDQMVFQGFVPTRFTLASVLSACGAVLDVGRGRRCHGVAIKIGLDTNMYVCNALLNMYAKCGKISYAVKIFVEMDEPNEVTFTTLMGGLAQTDRVSEALDIFRLMCRKGVCIDSVSLSSVLAVCARCGGEQNDGASCGQQVHGLTVKLGLESDLHLSNSLLDMYAKNGDMGKAEIVFTNLPDPTVVSWNVMIAGYGQNYQIDKALKYLQKMQSCSIEPDEVTYINMLAACIRSEDIESARRMFNDMSCPSVASCNAMLSGYSQTENHREVIKFFQKMQFENICPDRTTIAIILSSCTELGLLESGKQIHAVLKKSSFYSDVYVGSALIGMYSKCGKMDLAKNIFLNMPELDIVCWNTMIAGFLHNSLHREGFTFYKQLRDNEIFPTEFSYSTILSCCANLSSSFQGRQIHAQIEKDGYKNDIFVGTALIDMYCKCGDVGAARQFFESMTDKSTVTWNEMIHGYAQSGCGDEAFGLYKDMIFSGIKPDSITFIAVLTACSHSGLVDEAMEIFNSMKPEHGVDPLLDHYTCVVDSLGRAGRFLEAESVMGSMPMAYKDDPIIWEVLLSSCRVHDNLTLAKRAAEELIRLDPKNSAPYVLLGNIYSSLGRWDDARNIREMMIDKQVTKNTAYSWIDEGNNKIQTYLEAS
ncbi:hypothetical protein ACFE04_002245 [Oxalis oulophora]